MEHRPTAVRQASPRRKPWHLDFHIQRTMLRDIAAASQYATGRLLDVGCGRAPYQALLANVSTYVGLDANHGPGGPQVSGLGYALPFEADSFDTVLSTQTLEHVELPHVMMAEMARVLRPGGHLILTAPQTWRLHEKPYDFYRYTRFGLQHLIRQAGLEETLIQAEGGVWMVVGQTVNNALHARLRHSIPYYFLYGLYLISNSLFGWLDTIWFDPDETLNYVVVARKPLT